MKKKSLFEQISTAPSPRALKWAGQEVSILSSILLWGLWICRVFSLLQILKLVYRKIATAIKVATTDEKSVRPNVPPMFCEIYYILWLGVMIMGYLFAPEALGIHIAAVYFLFESIVWVLYYTIFRRFYEESYSIYHELEYLTVLILVIPTQALGFGILFGQSFGEILSGLVGAGTDVTPVVVRVFGALYAAIVVGMIISAFPTERVKEVVIDERELIIGCGDVVENRLYPALIGAGREERLVRAFDLSGSGRAPKYCVMLENEEEIIRRLRAEVNEKSTVWIETPPFAHITYLKEMIMSPARLIVLEKPAAITREELIYLEELIESAEARAKIFFSSYYVLEKALPLYFLADYNASYLPYLCVEDKYLAQNWRQSLGRARNVEVYLGEREDTREWVKDDRWGGQLYETFIHNVLVASLFVGAPQYWEDVRLLESEEAGIVGISLEAKGGNANISLSMRKNLPECEVRRYAKIEFEYGTIFADFDAESAEVHFLDTGRTCKVSLKNSFKTKYSVIVDLVRRVATGECAADDVDGLINQLAVLRWLVDYRESIGQDE